MEDLFSQVVESKITHKSDQHTMSVHWMLRIGRGSWLVDWFDLWGSLWTWTQEAVICLFKCVCIKHDSSIASTYPHTCPCAHTVHTPHIHTYMTYIHTNIPIHAHVYTHIHAHPCTLTHTNVHIEAFISTNIRRLTMVTLHKCHAHLVQSLPLILLTKQPTSESSKGKDRLTKADISNPSNFA